MSDMTSSIFLMVAMFAIFYFLLIRPQKKKEKQVAEMRNALKVGDEIITIGGIYGRIVKVSGDKLTIQTSADRTKMEIARWAISGPANEQQAAAPAAKKEAEAEEKPNAKPAAKSIKKLGQKAEPEAAAAEPEAAPEEPAQE